MAIDFSLPELGEGVYEAELIRVLVEPGQRVKRGQGLLEVMTDKASMEVPSPFAGTIDTISVETGSKIKVGQVVLAYSPVGTTSESAMLAPVRAGAPASATPVPVSSAVVEQSVESPVNTVAAAPSVRHMARRLGIDLTRIRGTGPAGRILVDDLVGIVQAAPSADGKGKPPERSPVDFGRPGTKIKMQGIRRRIAEHLVDAMRRIPHYSYIDECDVTEMVRLRAALREPAAKSGLKLTYLAFFVKAVAESLKEVPIVNSSLNDETHEIVLHDRYHVGIAVAAPSGLVVPVIHDADKKDLFTVAAEIDRLSNDAKNNKIKLDDLRGGTFTVTSIGNIGGMISTPIINHPEVGIMGIGKVVRRPVYDEGGAIRPADLVYLSFSFDHRVIDGAVGAEFGNFVKKNLENPAAMLVPPRR